MTIYLSAYDHLPTERNEVNVRRTLGLGLGVAVAVVAAVLPASMAQAVSCGANACGWGNENFTSLLWQRSSVGWNNFTGYEDQVSSWQNLMSSKDAAMYSAADLKGVQQCMKHGYQGQYDAFYALNDVMRSGIVYSKTGIC